MSYKLVSIAADTTLPTTEHNATRHPHPLHLVEPKTAAGRVSHSSRQPGQFASASSSCLCRGSMTKNKVL